MRANQDRCGGNGDVEGAHAAPSICDKEGGAGNGETMGVSGGVKSGDMRRSSRRRDVDHVHAGSPGGRVKRGAADGKAFDESRQTDRPDPNRMERDLDIPDFQGRAASQIHRLAGSGHGLAEAPDGSAGVDGARGIVLCGDGHDVGNGRRPIGGAMDDRGYLKRTVAGGQAQGRPCQMDVGGFSRHQNRNGLRCQDGAGGGIPNQQRTSGGRVAGVGQRHRDSGHVPGLDVAIRLDGRWHHGVRPGDHAVQRLEFQIERLGCGDGSGQVDFGRQLVAAHDEVARGDGEGEIRGGVGPGNGGAGQSRGVRCTRRHILPVDFLPVQIEHHAIRFPDQTAHRDGREIHGEFLAEIGRDLVCRCGHGSRGRHRQAVQEHVGVASAARLPVPAPDLREDRIGLRQQGSGEIPRVGAGRHGGLVIRGTRQPEFDLHAVAGEGNRRGREAASVVERVVGGLPSAGLGQSQIVQIEPIVRGVLGGDLDFGQRGSPREFDGLRG